MQIGQVSYCQVWWGLGRNADGKFQLKGFKSNTKHLEQNLLLVMSTGCLFESLKN